MVSTFHALVDVVAAALIPALLVDLATSEVVAASDAFEELDLDRSAKNPAFELMRQGVITGYEYDRFIPELGATMRFWARAVGRPASHMLGVFTEINVNDAIIEHLTVLPVSPALRVVLHGAPLTIADTLAKLTPRETEILVRLSNAESAPAIADALYLSPSTVRNHLASIFRKFGVRSQRELLHAIGNQKLEMPKSPTTDVEADVDFQNADGDGNLATG